MDPQEEINFYEEIERIVQLLADICHRIRAGDEDMFLFRWRHAYFHRNSRHKSIVRWLGDQIPRGFVSWKIYDVNTLWQCVFTARSLVREIGNRLPIQPSKRPYFYMLHRPDMHSTKMKGLDGHRLVHSTPYRDTISPVSIVWEENNHESCQENIFDQSSAVVAGDAVRKITALEDELNRLRAQIAGFVMKQDDPIMPVLTPPTVTVPPPPPPPPLPPLPHAMTSTNPPQTPKKDPLKPGVVIDNSVLDMTAILKDLNQVKLKAVERSPGGTPLRRAPLKTKGTDPASIIADALKNKFAKSRLAAASPDKENLYSNSPGNSFSNTPSPQQQFRKPFERKAKPLPTMEKPTTCLEYKAVPLRV